MERFLKNICVLVLTATFIFMCGCGDASEPDASDSPEPSSQETTEAPASEAPSPSAQPSEDPTADPSASESAPALLKQKAQGPEVLELQQRLVELGYLPAGKTTSLFGTETEAAVKAFQAAAGLDADGVVGQKTREAIFASSAPSGTPAPSPSASLAGITIGLDPGHQAHGNGGMEPVSPGSSQTKAKVSSGTAGVATGVAEYVVNLQVAMKVKALLEAQGVNVRMTRESNDVDISNSERAQMMNDAGVDLVVRIHCDGENDASRAGAFILIPSGPDTQAIQAESRAAAEDVLAAFIASTGAKNLGLSERDDQTGFNWSTVPVINIEMGHMSNAEEDKKLVSDAYQDLCAAGIAQGIINHFS